MAEPEPEVEAEAEPETIPETGSAEPRPEGEDVARWEQALSVTLFIIWICIIYTLNILVLIGIARWRKKQTTAGQWLIASLAVSCLGVAMFVIPVELTALYDVSNQCYIIIIIIIIISSKMHIVSPCSAKPMWYF